MTTKTSAKKSKPAKAAKRAPAKKTKKVRAFAATSSRTVPARASTGAVCTLERAAAVFGNSSGADGTGGWRWIVSDLKSVLETGKALGE